jgi:hypothetical protein
MAFCVQTDRIISVLFIERRKDSSVGRRVAFTFLIQFMLCAAASTWLSPIVAAPRVQVRGASRLEVRASGPRDQLQVAGTLRDEAGSAIPDALLVVTPMADSSAAIPWRSVGRCSEEGSSGAGTIDHTVTTDTSGAFCLVGALARGEALLRVVYAGGPLHEGTRTDILWNARQQPLSIAFVPRPERVDLDAPRVLVFARASAPPGSSSEGLRLVLTGENGQDLASTLSDASGSAHFDFPSTALDGPGMGNLTASFSGTDDLAAAHTTATITRSVRVRLTAREDEVRGDPSRGLTVQVRADSSRGPVPTGAVEATLDHEVVGAGAVVDGSADVVLTYRPTRDTAPRTVLLRYRPDAPFYEQAGSIPVTVTAVAPSPWLRAVPIALAIVVAGWLVRGWWRPRRREREKTPQPTLRGESSVDIVRPSPARDRWTGKVVDAHDGSPIADARVRVVVPSFVDLDVVVDARTDASGAFDFTVHTAEKDLRLLVESPYHAEVERPLPPASEMVVALASRRRLLLDRLVRWARRGGKPWHQEPDPTPGHVIRVARGHRGDAVAVWAERVERGAYGPDPVDQRLEKEVRDLEPRGQALR